MSHGSIPSTPVIRLGNHREPLFPLEKHRKFGSKLLIFHYFGQRPTSSLFLPFLPGCGTNLLNWLCFLRNMRSFRCEKYTISHSISICGGGTEGPFIIKGFDDCEQESRRPTKRDLPLAIRPTNQSISHHISPTMILAFLKGSERATHPSQVVNIVAFGRDT
jgi:hypothetical protein